MNTDTNSMKICQCELFLKKSISNIWGERQTEILAWSVFHIIILMILIQWNEWWLFLLEIAAFDVKVKVFEVVVEFVESIEVTIWFVKSVWYHHQILESVKFLIKFVESIWYQHLLSNQNCILVVEFIFYHYLLANQNGIPVYTNCQ